MLFPKIKEKIGRPERGERVWRRKYLEVELNEERRDLGERVRGELEGVEGDVGARRKDSMGSL